MLKKNENHTSRTVLYNNIPPGDSSFFIPHSSF